MDELEIVIPEGATTKVEEGLVLLTEAISEATGVSGGYGLGGENGYGIDYENDVFMMKPFCWCDQEDCDWCNEIQPNFLYKPTNAKIFWYKWIGRSQIQKGTMPKNWLTKCFESLTNQED